MRGMTKTGNEAPLTRALPVFPREMRPAAPEWPDPMMRRSTSAPSANRASAGLPGVTSTRTRAPVAFAAGRADHIRRSQRLDRAQPLDHRALPGQRPHRDRERQRSHRQQTLRHLSRQQPRTPRSVRTRSPAPPRRPRSATTACGPRARAGSARPPPVATAPRRGPTANTTAFLSDSPAPARSCSPRACIPSWASPSVHVAPHERQIASLQTRDPDIDQPR